MRTLARCQEIRRGQEVGRFTGGPVRAGCNVEDSIAIPIEHSEQTCFVHTGARVDGLERVGLKEECDLHDAVIPQEANPAVRAVITSAVIGKANRHIRRIKRSIQSRREAARCAVCRSGCPKCADLTSPQARAGGQRPASRRPPNIRCEASCR